jgi:Calx-beta domain
MRSAGQNQVQNAKLVVVDAAGLNPITIVDLGNFVPNSALGSRVLIASSTFGNHSTPAAIPDFLMTNIIPQSYLAAGSLMFQRDTGGVLWRLSWGGAGYTGSNSGETTNDADGNFGPPVPGKLPSCGAYALLFKNAANAKSTNNSADYRVTSEQNEPFFNNTGASFQVSAPLPIVNLTQTDANASESPVSDTGKMKFARSSTCIEPSIKVFYTITGTATNGVDYNTVPANTTIPGAAINKFTTITAINDNTPEPNETVILTLTPNSSYTIGTPKKGTVTIHSNE